MDGQSPTQYSTELLPRCRNTMSSNIHTSDDGTDSDSNSESESGSVIDSDSPSDMTREEIHNDIAFIFLKGEFDDPEVAEHALELWKEDRHQITDFIDAYREVCLDDDE